MSTPIVVLVPVEVLYYADGSGRCHDCAFQSYCNEEGYKCSVDEADNHYPRGITPGPNCPVHHPETTKEPL